MPVKTNNDGQNTASETLQKKETSPLTQLDRAKRAPGDPPPKKPKKKGRLAERAPGDPPPANVRSKDR